MSSYGVGTVSSDIPTEDNRTEAELAQGRLENEKETIIVQKTNERLRKLTPDDRMYEAMENFLLGDPQSQIQLLGTKDEILGKAEEAQSKGEDLIARAQYETMAKVAIYQQDPALTKKSLDLASKVTDPSDRHATMQKTIEDNVDQVIKIARDYYQTKEKITAETEAEVTATAEKEKK
jgi:hypothetical protein